jgi:hypothetical protein
MTPNVAQRIQHIPNDTEGLVGLPQKLQISFAGQVNQRNNLTGSQGRDKGGFRSR